MKRLFRFFKPAQQPVDLSFLNSGIGSYSYYGPNCLIHHTSIGNFTSIGPFCVIGFGEHPTNRLSTSPAFYEGMFTNALNNNDFSGKDPVKIGHDVWIGANVFIKNGVTIGNGAIIGAHSVVLEDVPEYAICVGTPAVKIKSRFSEETVNLLEQINWWNKDLDFLIRHKHLFSLENEREIRAELKKLV